MRLRRLSGVALLTFLGSAAMAPVGSAHEGGPPAAAPGAGAAAAAGAGARPTLTPPDFTPSLPAYDEKEVGKLEAAISALADDGPRKAEPSLRLGGMYWAHSRSLRQAGDQVAAARELSKAVLNLLSLTRHPAGGHVDEALFLLGVMHVGVGKEDQARKFLQRLIKEHPDSRFVGPAYLIFGEYYFGVETFDNALAYYDKVLALRTALTWPFAAYRRAWSLQLLRRTKEAAAAFGECVRPGGPGTDAAAARIRQECAKDGARLAGG